MLVRLRLRRESLDVQPSVKRKLILLGALKMFRFKHTLQALVKMDVTEI